MSGIEWRSPASSAGSSSGFNQTPTGAPRPSSTPRCAFHSASGTTTGPSGSGWIVDSASTPTKLHDSGSTAPLRITRSGRTGKLLGLPVYRRLEGRDAEAIHGVHETLAA